MLVTCKYMSLPNLIADREIMPEFYTVGNRVAAVEEIVAVLDRWLADPDQLQAAVDDIASLRDDVIQLGANGRAASAILRRMPRSLQDSHAA